MTYVQLAVEHADHQTRYYPVERGWRVDAASRCIVIGRDLPRTYVPLDDVFAFTVERVPSREEPTEDEMVWLGTLSGYRVVTSGGDVTLLHRCGWTYPITNPVLGYLANLIDGPVSAHRDAGCNPHED